jgi:cytochrome d ubiquinol oxidase subunit I
MQTPQGAITEAGRQPWVVYDVMRTADAASPLVAAHVGLTTILCIIVYTFLLAGFLWFFLRTIIQGPETTPGADLPPPSATGRMQATPALLRK